MDINIKFVLDRRVYFLLLVSQLLIFLVNIKVGLISLLVSVPLFVFIKYSYYNDVSVLFDDKLLLSVTSFGAFVSGVVLLSQIDNVIVMTLLVSILVVVESIVNILTVAMYLLNKDSVSLIMSKRKKYDEEEDVEF